MMWFTSYSVPPSLSSLSSKSNTLRSCSPSSPSA
ncbi:GSCOCG00010225001-RA-CDS, partial [Cotesia congregata]